MNRSMLARDTAKNRDTVDIQVQAQPKPRNRFDARDKIEQADQAEQINQIESEEQIELDVRSELTAQTEQTEQTEQNEYSVKPLPWVPPVVPNSLTNTGNGQTHFTNDGISKTWSVPLKGDLKSTMILWAGYVYKELEGQNELLNSTPAFNIMVSNLKNYIDRSYLLVPPNFHSLKEIVDTFAGQAARKLGKQKESEHEAA